MPEAFYYADETSQPVGPMGLAEIRRLVDARIIHSEVLVCPAGEQEWRPLQEWDDVSPRQSLPPKVPPPPRASMRTQSPPTGLPFWLAPTSMGLGIFSLLVTFLPTLAFLIAVPAIVGGAMILRHPTSRQRGFALTAVLTGGLGALPGLLFLVGMFFGALSQGSGEAAAIEKVLQEDLAISREAKARFPNSAPDAARHIAKRMQGIDTTRCPAEFRLAFQRHANAWEQSVAYIAADTPLTAFLEGLHAGATDDYRLLGLSNHQASLAKQQIDATYRELKEIAAAYGARIPTS